MKVWMRPPRLGERKEKTQSVVRKQIPKFLFYFILFYYFLKFCIKTFSPPMCGILCILELRIGRRIQWCKNEFLGVPRFAFYLPGGKIQQLWVVD
jgi:hypothetical protein